MNLKVGQVTVVNRIGVELEYLVQNGKGAFVICPRELGRDALPLLGEIRTRPAQDPYSLVADLKRGLDSARQQLGHRGLRAVLMPSAKVPLATYKRVNKELRATGGIDRKAEKQGTTYNVYYPDPDIESLSDQIVENGKIQGLSVSCGLHLHFSSVVESVGRDSVESMPSGSSLGRSTIQEELLVSVSRITVPAIEAIVRRLDERLFVPHVEKTGLLGVTKYRHPGYFRLKPHGFEYRSLAVPKEAENSLDCLLDIFTVAFGCFELLDDLSKFGPGPGQEVDAEDEDDGPDEGLSN